jgi:excisionase family DNA binding protein
MSDRPAYTDAEDTTPATCPLSDRLSLRPKEAAAALGVSDRTLRTWMRDEGLPYLRLNGVVLIPRAGLDKWFAARISAEHRAEALADEILNEFSK